MDHNNNVPCDGEPTSAHSETQQRGNFTNALRRRCLRDELLPLLNPAVQTMNRPNNLHATTGTERVKSTDEKEMQI